ncbi:glycerol dehydratase reactivase beta/small subunit family protein [Eubacteriaceae bacterium ES3]|nr:glycerol dehydratase reactivase beta/small subunit family protein [Eubacteriaceae bacterium ES3]
MRLDYDAPKPEIKVLHGKNETLKCIVEHVLHGIEEEGLLFSVENNDEMDSIELAYRGAELSHLGVGIGITEKEVVLHFIKLKEDQPLFRVPSYSDVETLRALGSNAARIVKRMPFKELTNTELS